MVSIASDHGGYRLKEHIKAYLTAKGISVLDCGCDSLDSCDYPIFGKMCIRDRSYAIVAEGAVIEEEATVGAPPSDDPDWGIAVVAGGVTVGPKAVIKPSAMIREDVKGGEQA